MSLLAQDERLARRVGAITIVLVLAAIVFFVFVAGGIEWGRRVRVRAYFAQTGGLREGAPVIVGGETIGDVETIAPWSRGVPPPCTRAKDPAACAGPLADTSGVVVTLALEARAADRIPYGGDIFVAGRGPLSGRHVEIGPSPEPDGPRLADGDEARGIDPPTLDRVLQRTWANLTTARQFAEAVAPELELVRTELRALAQHLDELAPDVPGRLALGLQVEGLLGEVTQLREVALGGDPGLERLGRVLDRARATIVQARAVLDTLGTKIDALRVALEAGRGRLAQRGPEIVAKAELAIERIRAAIDKVDPLLAKVADLQARIARGEGSIGKLANDPEFPEDAKELGKILKRQPWRIIARPRD